MTEVIRPHASAAYVEDFALWEQELKPEAETLEQRVLDNPEEPQASWVESNADGTVTEAQYREQCYWVIGQLGHALDVMKSNIPQMRKPKSG